MVRKRWDTDDRGRGVASGQAFAENLAQLANLMADDGWVAEEPEAHLLPHLQAAGDQPGSLLRLEQAWSDGEIFIVELTITKPDSSVGEIRKAAVELAASIAEESTHVFQRRAGDILEFDIATGTATADGAFAPHGHLVRLRIHGAQPA